MYRYILNVGKYWYCVRGASGKNKVIEIIAPLLSGVKKRNSYYTGVSKNSDTPKWMVYSGKPRKTY